MNADHIVKEAEAVPFRPFTIRTTDHQEFIVTDRSRVGWNTKKDLVVYFDDEGYVVTIDASKITSMAHR